MSKESLSQKFKKKLTREELSTQTSFWLNVFIFGSFMAFYILGMHR